MKDEGFGVWYVSCGGLGMWGRWFVGVGGGGGEGYEVPGVGARGCGTWVGYVFVGDLRCGGLGCEVVNESLKLCWTQEQG